MRLTHESLIAYRGFHDINGLCHVRVFEAPGGLPVVIAGALDDRTGTSITNAIEMVAAAVNLPPRRHAASRGVQHRSVVLLAKWRPGERTRPT